MALARKTNVPAFETEEVNQAEVNQVEVNQAETTTKDEATSAPQPETATKVETTSAPQPETVKDSPQTQAGKTTTAVQERPAGAVGLKRAAGMQFHNGRMVDPYTELDGAFELETVRGFGVGTFPKISAELGGLVIDDREVGKYAIVDLISSNPRWMVVPGVDSDEARKLVRTSYDKVTIEGGDENGAELTVEQYLTDLRVDYPKADLREYCDLWGQIVQTDTEGVYDEGERQMVQIQLSPQSLKQWRAFRVNQTLLAARGLPVSARIKFTSERAEFNGRKFGFMKMVGVKVD